MISSQKEQAPALSFVDLSLDFEEKNIFNNLSFSVTAGKCTCLLGPSGCGKSTLLRLASGNTTIPFSGEITFSSADHTIGWMSQNDLLLPWMSLLDNVVLGAKLRGTENETVRTKARNLLQDAGLSPYEKALPATLSGGMRQRGALLRTLMEDGQVLLMDEPFSALDALTRLKLQDLAARMTKGKTVLLVTHDPMEALRMGDEILVLSGDPVTVSRITDLSGETPRPPGTPELTKAYANLVDTLLISQL